MALPDSLHDFETHRTNWRKALEQARDNSPPSTDDFDDKGYWEHEIRAFDYAMSQLDHHFTTEQEGQ